MFYLATAVLLGKGQRFKKHASLHAAFGQEIQRSGLLGRELHQWLRDAADAR